MLRQHFIFHHVIPAKAGIHWLAETCEDRIKMDSRFRGNDVSRGLPMPSRMNFENPHPNAAIGSTRGQLEHAP